MILLCPLNLVKKFQFAQKIKIKTCLLFKTLTFVVRATGFTLCTFFWVEAIDAL